MHSRFGLPLLLLLLLVPLTGRARPVPSEGGDDSNWEFLGAPYVTYDPDFGWVFGLGLGLQKQPYSSVIIHGAYSTRGQSGLTLKGETGNDQLTYVFAIRDWLNPARIYPETGVLPDPIYQATLQRVEFKVAALKRFTPYLEMGPDIWAEYDQGMNPETSDGFPVRLMSIPRFRRGNVAMLGLRARWRTTSAVRPIDGIVLDWAVRAGRADGIEYRTPRFTVASDFWAGISKPINSRIRFYSRLWVQLQSEAPTSVRYSVGGDNTLRGQPFNRDFGRRLVSARIQMPITVARNVTLFTDIAQFFLPFFPTWNLELELAPFADLAAAGDPDYGGWRRTRQGYGLSFRFVLPPELVFFVDLGYSPGGTAMFYSGAGESL